MGFVILGTYVYAKFKQNSFRLKHNGKDLQHLTITLGNRQHLIVVAYKNQKILLSASPNEIRYLCELRDRSFHSSKK